MNYVANTTECFLMSARGRPRNFDREAALARAMELFWARGFEGTSLAELTEAMGINAPSLYAAFGSKEALFHEAVALYDKVEGELIWQGVEGAATAYDAMAAFLHRSAETFSRPDKPAGCLIVLSGLHSRDTNPAIAAFLRQHRSETVGWLQRALQRGVLREELPDSLDLKSIATFYSTVQQGMSIQARDGASFQALSAVAEGAMNAWSGLTGVEPKKRWPLKQFTDSDIKKA